MIIKEFQGEYRWLSNFWRTDIMFKGKTFPTLEHAYQSCKCNSKLDIKKILQCKTPGEAKRLGRRIEFSLFHWEKVRIKIMKDLLTIKFSDLFLRRKLLSTGEALLEEGNYWGDTFWGIDLKSGRGKNVLGRLLMEIREELRNESKEKVS